MPSIYFRSVFRQMGVHRRTCFMLTPCACVCVRVSILFSSAILSPRLELSL